MYKLIQNLSIDVYIVCWHITLDSLIKFDFSKWNLKNRTLFDNQ